jgi:hypothetical protein
VINQKNVCIEGGENLKAVNLVGKNCVNQNDEKSLTNKMTHPSVNIENIILIGKIK